jgi:hypothetical protein
VLLCVMAVTGATSLIGCAPMTANGDAGCVSYGEARLSMPPAATVNDVPAAWAAWIADTDDRMTGACR